MYMEIFLPFPDRQGSMEGPVHYLSITPKMIRTRNTDLPPQHEPGSGRPVQGGAGEQFPDDQALTPIS
jgi:hypothetical protein